MSEWINEWNNELIDWYNELIDWNNEWMNEYMSEIMNEWMIKLMNEWMSTCIVCGKGSWQIGYNKLAYIQKTPRPLFKSIFTITFTTPPY